MSLRALLVVVAVGLITAPAVSAAPGPIDPVELYQSKRIDGARVGVDGGGSAAIVFDEEVGSLELSALSRSNVGAYGPIEELTRTANAELPPRILFEDSGRGFAAWGVATVGAESEWARRSAAGLFGAVDEVGLCGRFPAYDIGPDGTITLACSWQEGAPPNNDFVRFGTVSPTAQNIGANNLASGAGIDDNFLQPLVSAGDDGTVAIGWYEEDATSGANKVEVMVKPAGAGVFEPVQTLVPGTDPDFDSLSDLEVLPDGTVLALVSRFPGLELYTRPPGAGSLWSGPQPLLTDFAGGEIGVDAAGRATLAAPHSAGGMLDPTIISIATRPPGGAFGAFTPIASGEVGVTKLDVAPNGTAMLAWREFGESASVLFGALAAPGAAFGAPVTIAGGVEAADVALDPGGNALAVWDTTVGPDDERLLAGGIDSGAPPIFDKVAIPTTVVAGVPTPMSASASDWSGLREIRWTVPGASLTGADITHVFPAIGETTVLVTAVDRAGNAATVSRQVRVVDAALPLAPAQDQGRKPDTEKPTVAIKTRGRMKLRAFLRRGVRARIQVDEPSRLTVELLARAKGAQISARENLILATRSSQQLVRRRTVQLLPKRKLIGKARRFRVTLRVTAVDAAGNERVKRRVIRVR